MILNDDELTSLRILLEDNSGLDEDLKSRCLRFMRRGEYNAAVHSAFIVLEERLRDYLTEPGMTGTDLANRGFNSKSGPLAKYITDHETEREGLRELYSGAFKFFRNRVAHKEVDLSEVEGKAIVGFVNLLLLMLENVPAYVHTKPLPKGIELAIGEMEDQFGIVAANDFRTFLVACEDLEIRPFPKASDKHWIRFSRRARIQKTGQTKPEYKKFTVFWVTAGNNPLGLYFLPRAYGEVLDFDVGWLLFELNEFGFQVIDNKNGFALYFKDSYDPPLFGELHKLISQIVGELG